MISPPPLADSIAEERALPGKARPFSPWWVAPAVPLVVAGPWAAASRWFARPELACTLAGTTLAILLVVAAVTDVRRGKIYNWATYPAVLWALAINLPASLGLVGRDWLGAVGLSDCLLGFAACFVPMLLIFRGGGGGAGDVKLAGAMGALLGLERGFLALLCAYVAAGVGILALAIWTIGPVGLLTDGFRRVGSRWLPGHIPPPRDRSDFLRRRVRLGPYYAVGGLVVLSGVLPR